MTFDREGRSGSFDRGHATSSRSEPEAPQRTAAEEATGYANRLPDFVRSIEKALAEVRGAERSPQSWRLQTARDQLRQSAHVARFMRNKAAELVEHAPPTERARLNELLEQLAALDKAAKPYLDPKGLLHEDERARAKPSSSGSPPEPAAHNPAEIRSGDRTGDKILDHAAQGTSDRLIAANTATAPAPAVARSGAAAADPWQYMFGEASTPVNQLGRVQAPKGVYLRQKPVPGGTPNASDPIMFDTPVMVQRRTNKPTAVERWCYVIATDQGAAGFCEERFLAIDPPEPRARLHRINKGETLGQIATGAYGKSFKGGNDERLYVQGLYEANKDRGGIKLEHVDLSTSESWHRKDGEEQTLKVYRGVKVLEGMSLWIPSEEFIARLQASGAITSGSSQFSKAWRTAAEFADDVVEGIKYVAGFIVGILEGAWGAIADLFKGAAQLIETIATMLYHLVTGNPGRIKDMLMKWVDKMKAAWEHRGEIADEFIKKWNAPDGWDRGRFQGEVLGWVMMTVLIIIVTAGSGAAASAGSLAARFPQIVSLLKTVDVVGDVTTYMGAAIKGVTAAGKIPEQASDVVKGKLGTGGDVDPKAPAAGKEPDATVPDRKTPDAKVSVRGYAQHPRTHPWTVNPDGAVRSVDEAVEIARKHGVVIPDDVLIKKLKGKYLPDNTYARYFSRHGVDPNTRITWDEFYDKGLDELVVSVSDTVFHSDEAIVAILAHEMHELNKLRDLFEASGGAMSMRRLHTLISPGAGRNLHDEAWDVADKLVIGMRKEAKQ